MGVHESCNTRDCNIMHEADNGQLFGSMSTHPSANLLTSLGMVNLVIHGKVARPTLRWFHPFHWRPLEACCRMCTQWFSDAMALAGYVTMMVMMKLNYQSYLSSVSTVICHWLGLNCEEMCQWLLMSQVTGCAGQKCRVQVDLHSPANACSRHKHKLMRFVIGCNLYCVNSPSKYYY